MSEPALDRIIGDSAAIRELRALIARVAPLQLPVLIEGPTGSGKELVAEALHALSGRRGRFVALNVCALPDTMFEAALFGHVRGAFTGALADSPGYFAEADGGTLFLDEIGGLDSSLQPKLLRAIETGCYRSVGARVDRRSELRVVAASNQPIHELVGAGRFRADLAHRLSGVILTVRPLHERLEDIPALVRHFAAGVDLVITEAAMRQLQGHDWPGNVRELRNVIERAIAFADSATIHSTDIVAAMQRHTRAMRATPSDLERKQLLDALEASAWDTVSAAARLEVHRATVYRRMQRLGITRAIYSSVSAGI
jgi:DNA-binding NtrC family response regulator